MKSFATAALACTAAAQNLFLQEVTDTPSNSVIDYIEIISNWDGSSYLRDYEKQAAYIQNVTKTIKSQKALGTNEAHYTCGTRKDPDSKDAEAFDFLPVFAAQLTEANPTATYEGTCFEEIDFKLEKTSDTTFDVHLDLKKPKSLLCSEKFMFANTETIHLEDDFRRGQHKVSLTMDTVEAQTDFAFGGIKVYMFCDGIVTEVESLLTTLECFVGGLSDHPKWPIIGSHVPPYMAKANLEFIQEAMGLTIESRSTTGILDIDENLVKSGDFFLIMRLDGLDPMIMWGTGAHGAHCTMAMWFDDGNGGQELYVVESQDAWYWPTAGIQRTPFKTWLKQAADASFNVVWLPLSEASQQKFDVQAATDWFNAHEGLPYGYHNFLFGWINTPADNWPPLLPFDFVPILFSMVSKVLPGPIDTMFTQAMNKRLGVEGKTIPELAALAAGQQMGLSEVMAIVEEDGWKYTGLQPRDGEAYVCSAFTAAMYKAAGILEEPVNATEFTPRDNYMLDIFDTTYERPQVCVDADPNLPYCQLVGEYRVNIGNDYSKVKPYAHMNESCPSINPDYERPEGC